MIQTIPSNNYPLIISIAQQWLETAKGIHEQYQALNAPSLAKEQQMFLSCIEITELVASKALKICKDTDMQQLYTFHLSKQVEKIEGIMLTSNAPYNKRNEKFLEIHFLVTNPENIEGSIQSRRLKGIDASLLQHAEHLSQERDLDGVFLLASEIAVPFYQRFNYEILPPQSSPQAMMKRIPQQQELKAS